MTKFQVATALLVAGSTLTFWIPWQTSFASTSSYSSVIQSATYSYNCMQITCGSFQLMHMSRDDHDVELNESWIRHGCLLTNLSSFHVGWDKVMRGINDALDIGLGTVKVSHCRYCSYSCKCATPTLTVCGHTAVITTGSAWSGHLLTSLKWTIEFNYLNSSRSCLNIHITVHLFVMQPWMILSRNIHHIHFVNERLHDF